MKGEGSNMPLKRSNQDQGTQREIFCGPINEGTRREMGRKPAPISLAINERRKERARGLASTPGIKGSGDH